MKKIITLTLFLMLYSCSEFKFSDIIKNVDISDEPEVVEEVTPAEPVEDVSATEITPEPEEKTYSLDITDFNPVFDSTKHNYKRDDKLAVVGSSVAKYYPYMELNNQEDLKLLGDGTALEVGSVIKIIEVVEKVDTIHESFFRFDKDNNFFYKTIIDNNEVLVWGADLVFVDSINDAIKLSWYYSPDHNLELFKPYNGSYDLSMAEKRSLKKNRLSKTLVENPSSLIDLYLMDSKSRDVAMFFTSDYLFHVTNSLIEEVKEDYLYNNVEELLLTFIEGVISEIEVYFNDDNGKNTNYSKKLERVYKYFLVAKVLIHHIDDPVKMEEHLRSMPGSVIDEYYRIMARESRDSLILDQAIEYNKIDGAGVESNLYLCLEWLSVTLSEFKTDINQTRFSMIVMHIISNNEELYKTWQKLNWDVRYLSLTHDTLDMESLLSHLVDLEINIFPYWVEDDENLHSVNTLVDGEFSLFSLGQRMDNKLPQYLGLEREKSSVLDFISLIGSKTANSLLKQSEGDKNYWSNYEKRYKSVDNYISTLDDEFWDQSIYTALLGSLRDISGFEQSRAFYFMEKGMWNQKQLLSVVGAWVDIISMESKTDKKQRFESVINTSELSFRTEDIPLRQHFVEPNINLYKTLLSITQRLLTTTGDKRLEEFNTVLAKMIEITEKEINRTPISDEDNVFLSKLPSVIAKLIDTRTYSMVADISDGSVQYGSSYIHTELPYRWTFALDDDTYGKRVVTGYGYSIKEGMESPGEVPFWISQIP